VKDRAGERRRGTPSGAWLLGLACILGAIALASGPARAAGDAWSDDSRWASVRVGSAGSGARLAPMGSVGYGFGYTWFLANQLAWSATVQHDVLGRFGDASEIDVPITVEFTRHFHFSESARPYLGGGIAAIYHKTYRTGADEAGFRQGLYVATGGNAALSTGSLVGFDFRMMIEQDTRSINPTFPNPAASTRNWSMKLSYSRVL
jgi:hypothetical protein